MVVGTLGRPNEGYWSLDGADKLGAAIFAWYMAAVLGVPRTQKISKKLGFFPLSRLVLRSEEAKF